MESDSIKFWSLYFHIYKAVSRKEDLSHLQGEEAKAARFFAEWERKNTVR